MSDNATVHIVADENGEWSVKNQDAELVGVFASEGSAIARAWDLIRGQTRSELVIHSAGKLTQFSVSAQRINPIELKRHEYEDAEDEQLSREAERLLPSREQLAGLMARTPPSTIDYSQEDDEPPC